MPPLVLSLLSILIWSTLALLGSRLSHRPPLQTVGLSLLIGGLVGLPWIRHWRVPLGTLALGIGGIFGYHALLFTAFRLAPAVEVNLLQYLWPLLIVLLAPLCLPGHRLKPWHGIGALLGLAGAGLVVSGGRLAWNVDALGGYLLALAAAFVWAFYSLLTRRVKPFATGAVGAFCLVSGMLSLGLHNLLAPGEAWPAFTRSDLVSLVLLGLGPMGVAFYTWDAAMKRGDPRIIGALAYLTPLFSTLNLALFGGQALTGTALAAMGLIVAGAITGSMDLIHKRKHG